MKRLFFALCAVLLLAGCSDKKTVEEASNPYLPIAGLVIPREGVAGQNVIMQGRGFMQEDQIYMEPNGSSRKTKAPVIGTDATMMEYTLPGSLDMGFYVIYLMRDNKLSRIGGINVRVSEYNDIDFQLYAVSGDKKEIYPLSVSKQVVGKQSLPNSSVFIPDSYYGYVEALPNGKVYYSGFEVASGNKYTYRIGSYDMNTKTVSAPVVVQNYFAMGQVDGQFHVLKTADNKAFSLVKWDNGAETEVKSFDLSAFGISRLLIPDLKFLFHAPSRTILIYGNMGTGDNLTQVTYSLNLETGAVNRNGGNGNSAYWFATTGEKLYCFAVTYNNLSDEYNTQIFRIDNPQQWTVSGSGVTPLGSISKSGFTGATYSPVTNLIYGTDSFDSPSAVLSFNPETEKLETKKWIGPGVDCIFYAPHVLPED